MSKLPPHWIPRKKALLELIEQILDETDGWSFTYQPIENYIRIDFPSPEQRKKLWDSLGEVGSAFNDFLPRCDNCYKQLGKNAVGRMTFPGKQFCSAKCAEEYED